DAGIRGILVTGVQTCALPIYPVYQNGGEIPLTPRGDGFATTDGFQSRSPFTTTVDGHASYSLKLGATRSVLLVADLFNIFNKQRSEERRGGKEIRVRCMQEHE